VIPTSWWLRGWFGLVVVGLLPVLGSWLRGDGGERCTLDGVLIEPAFRVRVVSRHSGSLPFCSIGCAEHWIETHHETPQAVFVTDEMTDREIPATAAHYVRSTVVTNSLTGERRHVFAREPDAKRHARAARGRILVGPERPFAFADATTSN
jgi:hypothetical protein